MNCCRMLARARAGRHADADLARALGDADQHDVHDADAADQQRDRGDRAEQHGQRVLRLDAVSRIEAMLRIWKSSRRGASRSSAVIACSASRRSARGRSTCDGDRCGHSAARTGAGCRWTAARTRRRPGRRRTASAPFGAITPITWNGTLLTQNVACRSDRRRREQIARDRLPEHRHRGVARAGPPR